MSKAEGSFYSTTAEPEHLEDMLRAVVPATLAESIDWARLRRIEGSFVDEAPCGVQRDLLFHAAIGHQPVLLYLLAEQGLGPDHDRAFQLLRSNVRIWEHWRSEYGPGPLPAVFPIVVRNDERLLPAGARRLVDSVGFDGVPPDAADALREVMPDLGYVLHEIGPRVAASRADRERHILPWSYMLEATEIDLQFLLTYAASISPYLEDLVKTAADRLREEGREEGRGEGRAVGRAEGRATLLQHQLEHRFGPLPGNVASRLRGARSADIERWAEAVLVAASLEEVLDP